jgi:hypothetical protein
MGIVSSVIVAPLVLPVMINVAPDKVTLKSRVADPCPVTYMIDRASAVAPEIVTVTLPVELVRVSPRP